MKNHYYVLFFLMLKKLKSLSLYNVLKYSIFIMILIESKPIWLWQKKL